MKIEFSEGFVATEAATGYWLKAGQSMLQRRTEGHCSECPSPTRFYSYILLGNSVLSAIISGEGAPHVRTSSPAIFTVSGKQGKRLRFAAVSISLV